MRCRSRCWWMPSGRGGRASWSIGRIAAASITCSIARPAKFLLGKPFAKQTWAKGLDAKGRPERIPDIRSDGRGRVCLARSAGRNQLVFAVLQSADRSFLSHGLGEQGRTTCKGEPKYTPGNRYMGSVPDIDVCRRIRATARSARSIRRPARRSGSTRRTPSRGREC